MNTYLEDAWNFLIRIFAAIILWLSPISNYVNMVWLPLLANLIIGCIYTMGFKNEKFSGKKFCKAVLEFILFATAIICALILQKIMNDGTEIAKLVAVIIGTAKLFSIYENISLITGLDIIALVWKQLKSKIDQYLTGLKVQQPKNKKNETTT
jgi:uncharacterized membrane protein